MDQEYYKMSLENNVPKSKKGSKNSEDVSKELISQFEGAPIGQIWNNLSVKINIDRNSLQPIEQNKKP